MASQFGRHSGDSIELGSVIGRAFTLIRTYPGFIFGITFLFVGIPSALLLWLLHHIGGGSMTPSRMGSLITVVTSFCGLIFTIMGECALTPGLVDAHRGHRPDLGTSAKATLQRLPAIALLGFLKAVGFTIALMALVIPFLFVLARWSVVGPALIADGLGVNAAFRRSVMLSEGSRLRILGLLIVTGVLTSLCAGLIELATVEMFGRDAVLASGSAAPTMLFTQSLSATLVNAIGATIACTLYLDLREARDGPVADHLSDIFS